MVHGGLSLSAGHVSLSCRRNCVASWKLQLMPAPIALQADVGAAAVALEAVQPGGLPGAAVQGASHAQAAPADPAGGEATAGLRQHAAGAGRFSGSRRRSKDATSASVCTPLIACIASDHRAVISAGNPDVRKAANLCDFALLYVSVQSIARPQTSKRQNGVESSV